MRKVSEGGRRGGFTLAEIMIVLLIIGLLAAIAVPNFMQARRDARKNMCISNLRLIASAKDQAGLQNGMAETDTPTAAQIVPFLKEGVMPVEPLSGSSASYSINAMNLNPTCVFRGVPEGHQLQV